MFHTEQLAPTSPDHAHGHQTVQVPLLLQGIRQVGLPDVGVHMCRVMGKPKLTTLKN